MDERLISDMRRISLRRRNVRAAELHRLLTRAGFARRFGKGDHWVYKHPRLPRTLSIDPRNPVKLPYVELALQSIEEVLNDRSG